MMIKTLAFIALVGIGIAVPPVGIFFLVVILLIILGA